MKAALLALVLVAACGADAAKMDTAQRSMSVPVPVSGQAAAPERNEPRPNETRRDRDISSITVRNKPGIGSYVADGAGFALYAFDGDAQGHSACLTSCSVAWPPALAEKLPSRIDPSINPLQMRLATRPDGTRQLAFNDQPLYYADADMKSGDTFGHFAMGFGGRFRLVSPAGRPLAAPR